MRYIFVVAAVLCIISLKSMGQDLPIDEYGKIDFQEIVKQNGYSKEQLLTNARNWVKETYEYNKKSITTDSNSVTATGRFYVYVKGAFSKEIHGTIRYKVYVSTKDDKYFYQFTDFIFEYYKINRQYKYVPTGKEKPVEEGSFPGWQAAWDKDKKITYEKITAEIDGLKGAMFYKAAPPKKDVEKSVEQKPSLKEEFNK